MGFYSCFLCLCRPVWCKIVSSSLTHSVLRPFSPATSISCCADFHLHVPARSRSTCTATSKPGSGQCQPAGTHSKEWLLFMEIQSRQFPEHTHLFRHQFPNFGPSTTHTCETHSHQVPFPPAVPETGMTSGLKQWVGILLAVNASPGMGSAFRSTTGSQEFCGLFNSVFIPATQNAGLTQVVMKG